MSADLQAGAKSYDEVPYRGSPFRQTHPECLATIAHLLSLNAPPVRTARVLELGCCDGGNLLPMAYDLPDATFVGIDYSPVQIGLGREAVRELGLKNIDLRDISILDIGDDFGEFDYIISHGVFSWVPDAVADKMLDVCARHLSPDGIAYLSYNALPGWYMRGAVRDMMRYHALRFDSAQRRIQEARLLLDFVSGSAHGFNAEAYGTALRNEAELLKVCPDHYIYHEHLEDHSRPYYFHEFMAKAHSRGLDFMAESRLSAMAVTNYPEAQQRALGAIATNVVELEQFMDFLRNRTFRETLLHRQGRNPKYDVDPTRLAGMHVVGFVKTDEKVINLRPDKAVRFEGPGKVPVTTSNPLLKSALVALINTFPLSTRFETLLEKARYQMSRGGIKPGALDADSIALARGLLKIFMSTDLIELSIEPPRFVTSVGERPFASPVARRLAGDPTVRNIVTRRHDVTHLTAEQRAILTRCDGSHSQKDMARALGIGEDMVSKTLHTLERAALMIA